MNETARSLSLRRHQTIEAVARWWWLFRRTRRRSKSVSRGDRRARSMSPPEPPPLPLGLLRRGAVCRRRRGDARVGRRRRGAGAETLPRRAVLAERFIGAVGALVSNALGGVQVSWQRRLEIAGYVPINCDFGSVWKTVFWFMLKIN